MEREGESVVKINFVNVFSRDVCSSTYSDIFATLVASGQCGPSSAPLAVEDALEIWSSAGPSQRTYLGCGIGT